MQQMFPPRPAFRLDRKTCQECESAAASVAGTAVSSIGGHPSCESAQETARRRRN